MDIKGRAFRVWAGIGASLGVVSITIAATATPGLRPDGAPTIKQQAQQRSEALAAASTTNALSSFFTTTGKVYLSTDGIGTNATEGSVDAARQKAAAEDAVFSPVDVDKRRAGSVVRKAFLLAASRGESGISIADGDVVLAGVPVDFDESTLIPSSIESFNIRADVTEIVKPLVDAAPPGRVSLSVSEPDTFGIDGEVLAVIFDDPAEAEGTVSLFYGAQDVSGDSFSILLAEPVSQDNAQQQLRFSLGISFGFQDVGEGGQFSLVDVNGTRLTSSAGGQDDGEPEDGALLTVGGLDDSSDNPADPNGGPDCEETPRCDDELYDLKSVLADGSTTIQIDTSNPSNNDNIFFAAIETVGIAALVGEGVLISPSDTTLAIGQTHTLLATVQNEFGDPVEGKSVTFTVTSGPTQGLVGNATTNASGVAAFGYSSAEAGTDTVIASIQDSEGNPQTSNSARVTWEGGTPDVQFASGSFGVDESAGSASITLTRSGFLGAASSVLLSSADGSALAGLDYTAVSQSVSFAAGEGSKTVALTISDDALDEVDETLGLSLSNPSGAALGAPATATLSIADNDAPPTVSFSTASSAASEGDGPVSVTVVLSGASSQTIAVTLNLGGSAQNGADYGTSQSLSFAPGVTSQSLSIAVVDDLSEEGAETVELTLSVPANATPGTQTRHVLTIAASDPVPPVHLKKTSGGGAVGPGVLLLLAPMALLRRRRALITAAALGAFSAGASAADDGLWYAGLRAGPASSSVSGSELGQQLQQQGYQVTALVDNDDAGGTLYLGRRLSPYAAVEIGISHLGEYTARIDGKTRDREGLEQELVDRFPTGGNALSLLLRYDIPLFAQLYLTPRVGTYLLATKTKIEYDDGERYKDTDYGVGVEIDVGLAWRLTPRFSLGLGTGLLVPTSEGSIQLSYAQLEFAF